MPFVIAVVGQKGGAGKTTLSVNIAEALRLNGQSVVLLDTDPQRSSQRWRDDAEEIGQHDAVLCISTTGLSLRSVLLAQADREVVVIDTPPRMEVEARAAATAANLVLLPVSPGPADVWALERTSVMLDEVRATRTDDGPRVVAVMNRSDGRTNIGRAIPAELRKAGFEVAAATLANRVAFPEAMALGQGVISYEPAGQAAEELHALLAEVLG
jgi:chromosome partitioning protein